MKVYEENKINLTVTRFLKQSNKKQTKPNSVGLKDMNKKLINKRFAKKESPISCNQISVKLTCKKLQFDWIVIFTYLKNKKKMYPLVGAILAV